MNLTQKALNDQYNGSLKFTYRLKQNRIILRWLDSIVDTSI